MTFKERQYEAIGLKGLLGDTKSVSSDKNITKGQKTQGTLERKNVLKNAQDSLNTGNNVTKKHGILGSTISLKENAIAQVEQLLESSKLLLEDYMQRKSSNGITPGSSGALGSGEGVKSNTTQKNQLLNGYKDSVQAKDANTNQRLARTNNYASNIKPGTGTPKASFNFLNAEARNRGSENNAAREARLQQEFQAKQQEQQG
jgi:hypothetical protein